MRQRKISDETIAKMKELKEKGMTYYQIGRELGLSYLTVRYWVGDYKEKIRDLNKKRREKKMTQSI